jgi:cell division protein FtsN
VVIRRAELGDKGVYYRAMVGPFTSVEQATELCSSLKAAGGQCVVQKN